MSETPELAKPVEEKKESPLMEIRKSLTDSEKEAFFKAFLSDQPYEDEITVFHDKLKLRFRTLNLAENDVILTQQRYDLEAGAVRTDDSYVIRVIEYRLAASLVSINGEPFCPDIPVSTIPSANKSTYLVDRVKTMAKWNTFKLSNITDAFNKFEFRVMALTEESFKESF